MTAPPVDDDVLYPADLRQHPGERILLFLRMEAPVRGVGEEPPGRLFAVADDPVGPCGRSHQAAPLVGPALGCLTTVEAIAAQAHRSLAAISWPAHGMLRSRSKWLSTLAPYPEM